MELSDNCKDFIEYLKPGDSSWIKRGLIKNAPESAKKAYKNYKKREKRRIEKGID